MVERRLLRWSELSEVIRPRRLSGDATARRLARAATIGDLRAIALRRVPRAVVFLSSPVSRRTTGTHLVVDGALTRGIRL